MIVKYIDVVHNFLHMGDAVDNREWYCVCCIHMQLYTCNYTSFRPRVGSGAVRIGPTPFPDRRS